MEFIQSIVVSLASIFGVAAIWELYSKKQFADEILKISGVSKSLVDSGVEQIFTKFDDINWEKELKNVKELKIVFVYGRTFINKNRQTLSDYAKKIDIVVILPDYSNDAIVDYYNRQYKYGNYTSGPHKLESVKDKIIESSDDLIRMGIKVRYYGNTLKATYYLYGDKCVFAPFNHSDNKHSVPAIKSNVGGGFYDFCKSEIDGIFANSFEKEKYNEEQG
jgi:hypothetical protein